VSGEYSGYKGTVMPGSVVDELSVELAKTGEVVRVSESGIETVVPNINRKVKVVDPKSSQAAMTGTLLSVDVDRGVATVFFSVIDESQEFKFDHISKLAVD
jgi:hypothetical protein